MKNLFFAISLFMVNNFIAIELSEYSVALLDLQQVQIDKADAFKNAIDKVCELINANKLRYLTYLEYGYAWDKGCFWYDESYVHSFLISYENQLINSFSVLYQNYLSKMSGSFTKHPGFFLLVNLVNDSIIECVEQERKFSTKRLTQAGIMKLSVILKAFQDCLKSHQEPSEAILIGCLNHLK